MRIVVDAQCRSCSAEWAQLVGGTKYSGSYPCERCGVIGVIDAVHLNRLELGLTDDGWSAGAREPPWILGWFS